MSHSSNHQNSLFQCRKKYSDNLYLEIIETRIKRGRQELLSRWALIGTTTVYYGYRWRKVCGKNIFIPSLGRTAKDGHIKCYITIRDQFNGKMARAYLKDFKVV